MKFEKVVTDEVAIKEEDKLTPLVSAMLNNAMKDLESRFTVKEAHYIMFRFKNNLATSLLSMNLNYLPHAELFTEYLHEIFNNAIYANHMVKHAGKGIVN
jgi:hypothetical protein